MRTTRIRDGFMPWGGLALGTLGFFVAQQLGSDWTFQDCAVGSPWIVILATVAGLALTALGALASWRVFAADGEPSVRRMIAAVSLMAAVLFALAIVLPFIAALVIPRCWG